MAGLSMYRTLGSDGYSAVARQKGLYRSIEDETLQPQEHLERALALRLADGPSSVCVPDVVDRAITAYTSSSLGELQRRRSDAIAHWSTVAAGLPRVGDEPFHTALVEAMDRDLDLLDRGPERHRVPLQPVQVARYGAAVTGVVAYDQVFGRRAKVGPEPVSLAALAADQERVHASVVAGAGKAQDADKALLWKALNKEVSQGFGEVHLGRPGPVDVPDVFYPRFIAEQEKWDTEAWLRKPRPVDDATSNGVNGALQVLSHADCHTLDRFAESASLFMRRSREHGYRGGLLVPGLRP